MLNFNSIISLFLLFFILASCESGVDKKKRLRFKSSNRLKSQVDLIKSDLRLKSANQNLVYLPFKNPDEIVASNNRIDTTVTIEFATNQLYNTVKQTNITLRHRSYNGKLVGPTLRVKPGDSLLLNMVNKLPYLEGSTACDPFSPHSDNVDPNIIDSLRFNFTNLHTHGFHVSPMGHSDNIFVTLAPGCEFQNRIGLPENHAPGTFWYHAHYHGSTAIQVSSGMAGAVIIEGGIDTLQLVKDMEEKIFVLQQMPYIPDTADNHPERYAIKFIEGETFGPNSWEDGVKKDSIGWRTTINGQTLPIIEMESNEVQRWRFVHAGVRETVNLKLARSDGDSLEYSKLHVIAQDGITYGYRDDVDSMVLQPGYRVDMLIQEALGTSTQSDTLYLIDANSPELQGDSNESEKILAIIILIPRTNEPIVTTMPTTQDLSPYAPYPSLVDVSVTDSMQYVNFVIKSEVTTLYQINDTSFSHTNPPRKLNLNKVQEWTLTSSLGSHPYHIHVNHFQLMKKWKKSGNQWEAQEIKPIWKDTYFVQSSDSIIIKTVYKDYIGDFVIHCHILDHEDQGMMQCVRIDSANMIQNYLIDKGINFCGPDYSNTLTELVNQ